MNESPLEDKVGVLTISQAQQLREKTQTDANIWNSFPRKEGFYVVKPAMPYVLLVLDGMDKESPPRTSKFRPDSVITLTVGKLQSVGRLDPCTHTIRMDSRSDGPKRMVHYRRTFSRHYMRAYCTLHTIISLLVTQVRDELMLHKADKGHIDHYNNIKERCDRIGRHLGRLIQGTDIFTGPISNSNSYQSSFAAVIVPGKSGT